MNKESIIHFRHDNKFSQAYLPENWDSNHLTRVIFEMTREITNRFDPKSIEVNIYTIDDFLSFTHTKEMTPKAVVEKLRKDYLKGSDKITIL